MEYSSSVLEERKGTEGNLKMSDSKKGQNQSVEDEKGGHGKKSKKKKIIIAVIIILLLAAGAVFAAFMLKKHKKSSDTQDSKKRDVVVNKDNVERVADQLEQQQYSEPARFTAQMNFDAWHFATGDSESTDSYVANSLDNFNDIYFDIFLSDDQQNAIYESPILQRGSELRNVRLKKDLDAGTYDCVLVYHLVDGEQNTLGTASFTLKIIIEG
jgi:hypothetical protein